MALSEAEELELLELEEAEYQASKQRSAPKKAKGTALDTAADAAVGAIDGLTLGFADEIEGAAKAAYDQVTGSDKSFKESYQEHRDQDRRDSEARRERSPIAYGAGQVAGNIATGVGASALTGGAAAVS